MRNPLLMGVLNGVANRDEQLQPRSSVKLVPIAEVMDGDAADELHDEVRTA